MLQISHVWTNFHPCPHESHISTDRTVTHKNNKHRFTHQAVLLPAVATGTWQQCPCDRWTRRWRSSVSQGITARWTEGVTSHRPSQQYHISDGDVSTEQHWTLVITVAIGSIWNCNSLLLSLVDHLTGIHRRYLGHKSQKATKIAHNHLRIAGVTDINVANINVEIQQKWLPTLQSCEAWMK